MSIRTKWNKDILSKLNGNDETQKDNSQRGDPVVESFQLFNAKSYYADCKRFINGFKLKYVVEIIQEFLNVMACPFTSMDKNIEDSVQKMLDAFFMMECAKNQKQTNKPPKKGKRKGLFSNVDQEDADYNGLWNQEETPSQLGEDYEDEYDEEIAGEGFETLSEQLTKEDVVQFIACNQKTLHAFMENHSWIKTDSKHETQVAIWFMEEYAIFLKNKTTYTTLDFFDFLNELNQVLKKENTMSYIKSIPLPTLTKPPTPSPTPTSRSTSTPIPTSRSTFTPIPTSRSTSTPTPTSKKEGFTSSNKTKCDKEREKANAELKKDMGYIKEFVYRVMALPFLALIIYNVYYMFFSKSDYSYKDREGKESGIKMMTDFGCKHHVFHDWESSFRDMEKGYTKIATEFLFKPTLLFSVCMTSIQNSTTLNSFNQKYPYLVFALIILLFYSFYNIFMDEISKVFVGVKNLSIPTS